MDFTRRDFPGTLLLNTDDAACRQHRWCIIPQAQTQSSGHLQAESSVLYTKSCKHNLVLLRMDEIIARNMLS